MAVRPELLAYLKKEVEKGITEQQLRTFLQSKGYKPEVLDEAFAALHGRPYVPKTPAQPAATRPSDPRKRNKLGLFAFLVLFLPLVIGPVLFFLLGLMRMLLPLLGVSFACSLAALIMGIVSLRQIKRRGERGKAFAILAVVLGGLGVVGGILNAVSMFFLGSMALVAA